MGAVTGKGLSDLIRERFGVRWTALVMLSLLIANGGVTVSEFVGIAAASELFHISRSISVPLVALVIWWLVVKGSYRRVERVFLVMSLVFFGYIVSAFLAHPNWVEVARSTVRPTFSFDTGYLFTMHTQSAKHSVSKRESREPSVTLPSFSAPILFLLPLVRLSGLSLGCH
jgi:Mn2+/Fe2+ NRAMP family transporter